MMRQFICGCTIPLTVSWALYKGLQAQKVNYDCVYESVCLFLSSHHTIATRKMTQAELCTCEDGFFLAVHFSTTDSSAQQSTLSTDHDYSPYRASFCPQVLSDCLQHSLSVHLSDCSLTLPTAKQEKKERLFSLSTSLCRKVWLTRTV